MKKKIIIFVSLIFTVMLIWSFIDLYSLKFVATFLFVTDKNKMNWIGLTGIIAIVGLVYNFYDGRRRFRGDIRSKSRIDWMNSVRVQISIFVSKGTRVLFLNYEINERNNTALIDSLNITKTEFREAYYQIKLYIPRNESNSLILNNVESLFEKIDDYEYEQGYSDKVFEDLNELILNAGLYFKEEWEIAKTGN